MRALSEGVREGLDGGVATFCNCWRVARRDGGTLGFTDHDEAIEFGGLTFEPETGFTRSAMESGLGLGVDNVEAAGVLRSDAISEADIAAGRYDGAEVTRWLVDWRKPGRREKLFTGHLGEVRRGGLGFEAEVLGLADALDRPQGRVYLRQCDADVGDARCGVSLTGAYRGTGTVSVVRDGRRIEASGLDGVADGWFARGRLTWSSGANAGTSGVVRSFSLSGGVAAIEFERPPQVSPAPGDAFAVTAGCDKTAGVCREKFANFINFRGFPLMPGEDWSTAYPKEDEAHDGGSLFAQG